MATPYCRSRLALPTRECQQYAILRTNRTYDLRDVADNHLDLHPDKRQHNPRNNLKYSACNNSPAHLAFWFALILRRRLTLDSGAQHRRDGAFCGVLCFQAPSHERWLFSFLISFTREKSGLQRATSCSPKKTLLAASWTGVSRGQKAVRMLRGGKLVALWFSAFLSFSSLVEPLWMCQRPFASLHRDCWEGRLFALDTWDFLGWVFLGMGTGEWDASCGLFTSEHCAECAFLGLERLCFWESVSRHILGNGDGFMGAWV